ncbi:hypothetical protein PCANC_06262 [Puccinia coronata f. sp. avenae]|uniref:Uncharacterized protein n=1 Tax=Puccinia coronata f. sp. avenae TaxID=200324 RepID=A0A2N5SUQ5_9BASI|nr:hypothetical protein PCANC_10396 [Puccinia coronata f. sp. avenae]PLW16967.1 hypothetical protein PCASD_14878 [Puccinia coronata f. sp. avenae]PLW31667.1 hypothetical protein PCASD_10893 [Puccinia coronata f. sp. avenae]PLW52662.1 hypothetical protein PCANC_06262 [Puccinia coronata f. sp. avenae]
MCTQIQYSIPISSDNAYGPSHDLCILSTQPVPFPVLLDRQILPGKQQHTPSLLRIVLDPFLSNHHHHHPPSSPSRHVVYPPLSRASMLQTTTLSLT